MLFLQSKLKKISLKILILLFFQSFILFFKSFFLSMKILYLCINNLVPNRIKALRFLLFFKLFVLLIFSSKINNNTTRL